MFSLNARLCVALTLMLRIIQDSVGQFNNYLIKINCAIRYLANINCPNARLLSPVLIDDKI